MTCTTRRDSESTVSCDNYLKNHDQPHCVKFVLFAAGFTQPPLQASPQREYYRCDSDDSYDDSYDVNYDELQHMSRLTTALALLWLMTRTD